MDGSRSSIKESLSARRAWIEIKCPCLPEYTQTVALRKESVDRNPENPMIRVNEIPSLSARRAWIEIESKLTYYSPSPVALRKESVDRNFPLIILYAFLGVALRKESVDRNHFGLFFGCYEAGRSPQGERG